MLSISQATGLYYPRTMTITLEAPMESISQYSSFMIMMMLNHHKLMLNERLALAAMEFEKIVTNSLAISRISVRIDFD